MKKSLLLFSLVAILGIFGLKAETVTVDFKNCNIPEGWKVNANVNTDPNSIYWQLSSGYPAFKSGGAITSPELTNVKSMTVVSRGNNIRLQYKKGLSWVDVYTICPSGVEGSQSGIVISTEINMPDAVRFSSHTYRFYVENGGSQWIQSITYTTGEDHEVAPAPKISIEGKEIIITRMATSGYFKYYNGPKEDASTIADNEWIEAIDANDYYYTSVKLHCLEGLNYVHAYQVAPNSNYSDSAIVTEAYGQDGVYRIEADSAEIRVENGSIVAPEGAEVYTLNGARVAGTDLAAGVYVVVYGGKAQKVIVK